MVGQDEVPCNRGDAVDVAARNAASNGGGEDEDASRGFGAVPVPHARHGGV